MEFFFPQFADQIKEVGARRVWDPERVVLVLDHRVPAVNVMFANKHKRVREFVKEYGIKTFFDVGRGGISHQITAEQGIALPGILYFADDTHAPTLGGLGCVAIAMLYDMVEVLATGKTWLEVPKTINVNLEGAFPKGVTSRDLAHWVISRLKEIDVTTSYVLEYTGKALAGMSIDSRMTLCCLAPFTGASTAIINPDLTTFEYFKKRRIKSFKPVASDEDAYYADTIKCNISSLEPLVAVPHSPKTIVPLREIEGVHIDQCYLGSCAGGRIEDLRMVARILKGHKIKQGTRFIFIPPSQEIFQVAIKEGIAETIISSGGIIGPPGCGACPGGHLGVLGDGENCVSTSTLNLKGRMGSPKANIYLANDLVVATASITGVLADPKTFL